MKHALIWFWMVGQGGDIAPASGTASVTFDTFELCENAYNELYRMNDEFLDVAGYPAMLVARCLPTE